MSTPSKKLTDTQILVVICVPLLFIYGLFALCYGISPIDWSDDTKVSWIAIELFVSLVVIAALTVLNQN